MKLITVDINSFKWMLSFKSSAVKLILIFNIAGMYSFSLIPQRAFLLIDRPPMVMSTHSRFHYFNKLN